MIKKYVMPSLDDVFFTSDTHFCHNKEFLYTERGFASIEEHDEALISAWNRTVGEKTIWHLGDFILGAGRDSETKAREILNQLSGKIYLLWGNHNAGVKQIYRKAVKDQYGNENLEVYPIVPKEFPNLTFVGYQALVKISNKFFFLSHYAHRIWIDMNHGVMHLCGHSHGTDKESQAYSKICKRLDVGVDNFYPCIDADIVLFFLKDNPIVQLDHHTNQTSPSF